MNAHTKDETAALAEEKAARARAEIEATRKKLYAALKVELEKDTKDRLPRPFNDWGVLSEEKRDELTNLIIKGLDCHADDLKLTHAEFVSCTPTFRGTFTGFARAQVPPETMPFLTAFRENIRQTVTAYMKYAYKRGNGGTTNDDLDAITLAMIKAYACMERIKPSFADVSAAAYGYEIACMTDNRMTIMQAFDFMKEMTESALREAPRPQPKTTGSDDTKEPKTSEKEPLFGERKATSQQEIARLRALATNKRASNGR